MIPYEQNQTAKKSFPIKKIILCCVALETYEEKYEKDKFLHYSEDFFDWPNNSVYKNGLNT